MSEPHRETPVSESVPRLPQAPPTPNSNFDPSPVAAANYSSLSVMALIGFSVSAVFAAVLLFLGLYALITRSTFLLGNWIFVFPVLGLLLSALAWSAIHSSEGALAGKSLARWGVLLGLFVGLGGLAYKVAVYMAIRQQASVVAEKWLRHLTRGELGQAGYMIIPPEKRLTLNPESPTLLREVEERMSIAQDPNAMQNRFSSFAQTELVRLLQRSGEEETKLQLRSIQAMDYTSDGYKVVLIYQIETPDGQFEAEITLLGSMVETDEGNRRLWRVDDMNSRLSKEAGKHVLTERGKTYERYSTQASTFVGQWHVKLGRDKQAAFLQSLPAGQRATTRELLDNARLLGAAAGAVGIVSLDDNAEYSRFLGFLGGEFVTLEEDRFPDDEELRKLTLAGIRQMFSIGSTGVNMRVPEAIPQRRVNDGKIRFFYDVQMRLPPAIAVEGILEVEADERELNTEVPDSIPWRAKGIRLLTGRVAGAGPTGGARPPQP